MLVLNIKWLLLRTASNFPVAYVMYSFADLCFTTYLTEADNNIVIKYNKLRYHYQFDQNTCDILWSHYHSLPYHQYFAGCQMYL